VSVQAGNAAPDGLRHVSDARRAVDAAADAYTAVVFEARERGHSVQAIADAAGVSRQAIYQALGRRPVSRAVPQRTTLPRLATPRHA
jgi:DNA-binding phage protein